MISREQIAGKIQEIGFSCLQCSTCCREIEENSNLVMVMPGEIRAIMNHTGLSWQEIVDPYPQPVGSGLPTYTIGWTLKRQAASCCFLKDHICMIHSHRPWICRTYPFMLDDDKLVISPCPGLGKEIHPDIACIIADTLLRRKQIEESEEAAIKKILTTLEFRKDNFVVIDSEGIKTISGVDMTTPSDHPKPERW
jgi:hypothetical protein